MNKYYSIASYPLSLIIIIIYLLFNTLQWEKFITCNKYKYICILRDDTQEETTMPAFVLANLIITNPGIYMKYEAGFQNAFVDNQGKPFGHIFTSHVHRYTF